MACQLHPDFIPRSHSTLDDGLMALTYCTKCPTALCNGDNYCHECGAPVVRVNTHEMLGGNAPSHSPVEDGGTALTYCKACLTALAIHDVQCWKCGMTVVPLIAEEIRDIESRREQDIDDESLGNALYIILLIGIFLLRQYG
jgi:hypothetical protein